MNLLRKYLIVCAILGMMAAFLLPAVAGNQELLPLLKVLKDNKTITEEQYQQILNAAGEEQQNNMQPGTVHGSDEDNLHLSSKGGFTIGSDDGKYQFDIGGRLFMDAAYYQDDKTDIASGTDVRSARLDFSGKIAQNWIFEANFNFADNEVQARDFWVGYFGFPVAIKVGQFKVPFSLEEQTSSKYTTFMADSLANAFSPGYRIGLGLMANGKNWSTGISLFGEDADNNEDDNGEYGDDEGWGIGGRVTYAPFYRKDHALHLGIGAIYETPTAEAALDDRQRAYFRIRTTPEADINAPRLVSTGRIYDVDYVTTYGLELAGVWGPLSLQGEYMHSTVVTERNAPDYDFGGYYAQLSWFPTGESRNYDAQHGEFHKIKPKYKFGALEAALRYSSIDLNDADISGGEENNITLGLNWYFNSYVRLMANYVLVDTDAYAGNDDPRIFMTRFHLHF